MNWLKRYFLLLFASLILLAGLSAIAWTLAQREAALRHQAHQTLANNRLQAAALQLQTAVAEARQLSIELANPNVGDNHSSLRNQARMSDVLARNPLIGGLALIRHLSEHERKPFEHQQGLKVQMFYQGRLIVSPPMNDYYILESYLPDNASALPLGVDVGGLASWSYALRDSRRDREPRLVTDNPGAEQQPQLYLLEALPSDELRWLVLKIAPNVLLDRTLRAPGPGQAELRIILSNGNDRLLDSQPNEPPLDPTPLASTTVKLGGQSLTLTAFELAGVAAFKFSREHTRILALAGAAMLLLWLLHWLQAQRSRAFETRMKIQQQQLEEGARTLRQQVVKREQSEQALAESEARQRALLLASTDAILLIDQNGQIRSANPTAASLIGQSAQSLNQLPVSALVASLYRPDPDVSFDKVASGKLGQPFETELIRVDNQRIPVEISLSRVVRPDEEFFVAVCRNIQQRKLQETALLELQAQLVEQVDRQSRQLAALLEASPLAMAYVVDGRFREVNRVFLDLFEHDQLSVIDQSTRLLFGNTEDWNRHSRAAAQSLNTGQVFQTELNLLTGQERWIVCRLFGKALNPAAPKLGSVWLYQDISLQKATEAALTEAKELAEQTSRAKTEFLANMSHELRTPMHAILGFAEMGLNRAGPDDNPKLKHYFERVHLSGSRLLSLLNELLDLAKMEIGRMEYRIDRHDLAAVIHEAYDELAPMAAHAGSQIEVMIEPAPLQADFDAFRIGQVLRNLLSNAIKYNPPGETITVEAHLLGGANRELIAVTVRDHGPGIPPAELDSIFDKFIQSSTTKTGAGGTGLGLAISREIVHAHQGMIRAGNAPDGGAELRFTLPRWNTGSTEEGVMHDPHFTAR